jgi:hypothetical protein
MTSRKSTPSREPGFPIALGCTFSVFEEVVSTKMAIV